MKFEDFGLHSLFLCGFTVKLRVHGLIYSGARSAGHGRRAWTPGMDARHGRLGTRAEIDRNVPHGFRDLGTDE